MNRVPFQLALLLSLVPCFAVAQENRAFDFKDHIRKSREFFDGIQLTTNSVGGFRAKAKPGSVINAPLWMVVALEPVVQQHLAWTPDQTEQFTDGAKSYQVELRKLQNQSLPEDLDNKLAKLEEEMAGWAEQSLLGFQLSDLESIGYQTYAEQFGLMHCLTESPLVKMVGMLKGDKEKLVQATDRLRKKTEKRVRKLIDDARTELLECVPLSLRKKILAELGDLRPADAKGFDLYLKQLQVFVAQQEIQKDGPAGRIVSTDSTISQLMASAANIKLYSGRHGEFAVQITPAVVQQFEFSYARFFGQPALAREIELAKAQKQELQKLESEQATNQFELMQARVSDVESLIAAKAPYQERMLDVILPHQRERARELALQRQVVIFGWPEYLKWRIAAEGIAWTEDQEQRLIERVKEIEKRGQQVFEDFCKEYDQLPKTVLSKDQQKRLAKIMGERPEWLQTWMGKRLAQMKHGCAPIHRYYDAISRQPTLGLE